MGHEILSGMEVLEELSCTKEELGRRKEEKMMGLKRKRKEMDIRPEDGGVLKLDEAERKRMKGSECGEGDINMEGGISPSLALSPPTTSIILPTAAREADKEEKVYRTFLIRLSYQLCGDLRLPTLIRYAVDQFSFLFFFEIVGSH